MTERGRDAVRRTASELVIGPSAMTWDGTSLTVRIDEVTAPLPGRLRGTVRVHPGTVTGRSWSLDAEGRHRWWPIAPASRVEVALENPGLRWSGPGYFDTNAGSCPLEDSFTTWDWSRAGLADGRTAVLYDVRRRGGDRLGIAFATDRGGDAVPFEPPPAVGLPSTRWRVPRASRADEGRTVSVIKTLEDTPFYARSMLATHLQGGPATAVHESLSLDRFTAPWVQLMLPFRMPRALR